MKRTCKQIYFTTSIGISLVIILLMGLIVYQRAFSYDYNQRANYQYELNSTHSEIIDASINNNFLDLSELPKGVQTVFAEIDIRSTLKGFAYEPEVKMMANGDTVFQNFECRAKGIRYLNLSNLVQQGAKNIKLEFEGCKLKNASIKLIAFKNPDLSKEKILILAPHPDDAEIAAYGLYASNPDNTFIATITAGDAGSMRYGELYSDSTIHYIKKGQVRAWNSITVPMLGGIAPENAINLGYFDASLKNMHNDTTSHGFSRYLKTDDITLFRSKNSLQLFDSLQPESNWRSLVNDLKYLLLKKKPTIVVSTFSAIDWHNDHKFTTVALIQAMQELNYDSCQLWLYTNHFPLTEMYPNGKIGSATSLPPSFEKAFIYFDRLSSVPLSKTLQADKVLALDAMNDLRPDTQYRNTRASWLQTKQNFFDKLYLKESDYFRRSVRSNELFFVIEGKNALQPEIQAKLFGEL